MDAVRNLALFCFLWLPVGFSLGTSTLFGPVRWVTRAVRDAGSGAPSERSLILAVIVVYVLVSALVAAALTMCVLRTPRRHVRWGVPALAWVAALVAVALFLNPVQAGLDRGDDTDVGSSFTFGPYPSAERLRALKQEGYTAVVPLLHPAVVPFEPKLLADERAAAREIGIDVVHVPMLPWIDGNEEALAELERLAREGRGRYYVHCYLGRDRVLMARSVVERHARDVGLVPGHEFTVPSLANGVEFERGAVVELSPDVFLGPFPTDDEWTRYFTAGRVVTVVSLLEPADPGDARWIAREREVLSPLGVEIVSAPSPEDGVEAVRGAARPVYVHAFLGVDTGRAPKAEAFRDAWARVDDTAARSPRPDEATAPPPPALRRFVPRFRDVVLLAPPLLLFAGFAGRVVSWMRTRAGVQTPYTRKVFHFAIFTVAGIVHVTAGLPGVVLFGIVTSSVVLYAVVRGEGFPLYEALARPTDAPRRSLFVLVPLVTTAVGGVLSNLLFGATAVVGYLVGGWGDAVGEPVGTAYGRHRYKVPSLGGVPATRSIEGSVAVALCGAGAAWIALLLLGQEPLAAVGVAAVCGLVGAAVEAVSHHGLDNLTIQVAAAGVAAWFLGG